jgi:hypothetical protein
LDDRMNMDWERKRISILTNNGFWNIFYDRGYVHIDKRWRRDKFMMFLISDSITLGSLARKKRYCGDSAAEWSQHQ